MPELPEVETIRRDLSRVLRRQRIHTVAVKKPKIVHGTVATFKRKLRGRVIRQIKRRGKLLIITLEQPDLFLLVHLKMTGQLIYRDKKQTVAGGHGWPKVKELPNKYSHIIFTFSDQSKLFFNDLRQFGYMRLVNSKQLQTALAKYGAEPLSAGFTAENLYHSLRGRKTYLKNVLLDQRVIAGLGNIYVDESCYHARIKPTRPSRKVNQREAGRLYQSIRKVLTSSLRERGTTFSTYRDGLGGAGKFVRHLCVYGRGGQPCKKCRSVIIRTKVGGRGTAYCPVCQS